MTTLRTPILRIAQCELPPMFWFLSGHEVQWRSHSAQLKRKRVTVKAPHECESLDDIRREIDIIDHEIIEHISRRFDYVKEVMRFKTTEADVRAPER